MRSSKQIKEIDKLSEIYGLVSDDNVIFLKNGNWLIIPRIEKREDIIREALPN